MVLFFLIIGVFIKIKSKKNSQRLITKELLSLQLAVNLTAKLEADGLANPHPFFFPSLKLFIKTGLAVLFPCPTPSSNPSYNLAQPSRTSYPSEGKGREVGTDVHS